MDSVCRLDFETRSPVDIRIHGAWLYASHPETEILCMAYDYRGESGLWVPDLFVDGGTELPSIILNAIEDRALFEAHNAFFERCIWHFICVGVYGWPAIPLEQWRCSAAVASAHALPRSLEGVAQALGLQEQKDSEGHRIMLKLSKPRKPSKNNPSTYFASVSDFEKLYSYCTQDVVTEKAVSSALSPLSPQELEVWRLDQKINSRGVYADREAIEGALKIIEEYNSGIKERLEYITNGAVTSISEIAKIVKFSNHMGAPIKSLAKDYLEEVLKNWELDPIVRELLEIRLSAGKSSTKKYKSMLDRMDFDNRIRELIVYHGASTGRWAGRGIQIQNFPRGTFKDFDEIESAVELIKTGSLESLELAYQNPMEILSSCLRGMLCAPEGHTLYCADYSAIEARAVMWLAGESRAVEMFRHGGDIYKELASTIFKKPIEEISSDERFLGKVGILGAGYQMGGDKFQATCEAWGLKIDNALAHKAVDAYRTKYKKVQKIWGSIERTAIRAVCNPNKTFSSNNLFFRYEKNFLKIKLPGGRCLCYYDPKIKDHPTFDKASLTYMGISAPNYKWERQWTYGGKLFENVIQGLARDIMAHAMIELEKEGYPIVLTVHDEIVSEVPEDSKGLSFSTFCEIMSTVPDWARGLPLAVEGWEGRRFRK